MTVDKDTTAAENSPFLAPSLPPDDETTHTYLSEIPKSIQENMSAPCILGVDEAGRGPVIGPMVYALSYCRKEFEKDLRNFEFADSKVLSPEKRLSLFSDLCNKPEMKEEIGWATTAMSAQDISSGMLKPLSHGVYNLNAQAHDTTMELIQKVIDLGVNVKEVYVDTVGHPGKYQDKLSQRFPGIQITVAKKADSLYPIVSAASICAKVTRDQSMCKDDSGAQVWGSGYPSDPNTVKWLESSIDHVFGWGNMIRFSWQTTRDIMERSSCAEMQWADELVEKNMKISDMFSPSSDPHFSKENKDSLARLKVSTRYFGRSCSEL